MKHLRSSLSAPALLLASLGLLSACDGDGAAGNSGGTVKPPPVNPDDPPAVGESSFVSADGREGDRAGRNAAGADGGAGAPEADDGAADERTVEEGDIYRVAPGGLVVNLNSYRGLQLIDVSNPSAPSILGRADLTGYPVEMYIVGNRAVVLMNNWIGYWGARDDLGFGRYEGGLVVTVDFTDRANPRIIDRAFVPGFIQTSRLAREGEKASLYVAAQVWEQWDQNGVVAQEHTVVKSFDVSDGRVTDRNTLELGGYVSAIQATPSALLVARNDWEWRGGEQEGSQVSVIDISSPDGRIVQGGQVQVSGIVQKKSDLDLRGDILRIVSAGTWNGSQTNHLETFNVADIATPEPVDHETFGAGQQLFATLFQEDRAFFVTYLRQDPFHAFSISPEGDAEEHNEFVVSGWNDWFKPAFEGQRLLGIGYDDAAGTRALAVSLYDTTDLDNPEPLVERAAIDLDWGWSEASWDDRAFSVIEGAVALPAEDGTMETGLVLLPFSGWAEGDEYAAGVQIFTFSDRTLTLRGRMDHDSPVRRSFNTQAGITANLSDTTLALHDTSDPESPDALGQVELSPDYADVLVFGEHVVRVNRRSDWWWYAGRLVENDTLEVLAPGADPDRDAPVATLDVPPSARLHKIGDLLVAQTTQYVENAPDGSPKFETTLQVIDLTDPASPRLGGQLVTRDLRTGSGYYGGPLYDGGIGVAESGLAVADCFDCWGWGWGWGEKVLATSNALAFVSQQGKSKVLGRQRSCQQWPDAASQCWRREGDHECVQGWRQCTSIDGGAEVCQGEFSRCSVTDASYACEPIEYADVDPNTLDRECWDSDYTRYWSQHVVDVVDLSNPDAPTLSAQVDLPENDEAVDALVEGDKVWLAFRRQANVNEVEGDERPFVRYFMRALNLSDPSEPTQAAEINVPGQLIAVDGAHAWFQDFVWGADQVNTALAKVTLRDGLAFLDARRVLPNQLVDAVRFDARGNLLVTHRESTPDFESDNMMDLSIFAASDLEPRSTTPIDAWASLNAVVDGKALFQVPGGILTVNVVRPEAPRAQAYFPLNGWPSRLVPTADGELLVPAGRYGVYRLDLDSTNLLARDL